jgi:hypothetical protein
MSLEPRPVPGEHLGSLQGCLAKAISNSAAASVTCAVVPWPSRSVFRALLLLLLSSFR